jgi:hypothetical protein
MMDGKYVIMRTAFKSSPLDHGRAFMGIDKGIIRLARMRLLS